MSPTKFSICRLTVVWLMAAAAIIADGRADAATYYISPQGSDAAAGTEPQPWRTFQFATQRLRRGDTLVLLDGIYYESLIPFLPATSSASPQYVTIRAKNDGQAILDGQGVRRPVQIVDYSSSSHLIIEGIVARRGSDAVYFIRKDHVILRRCSGYDADPDSNSQVILVWANDVLVEDCVAAGTGRKMLSIFEAQRVTVRRVFAYWTRWDGRNWCGYDWPAGSGIEIYDTSNNLIENSIAYARTPQYGIGFKSQDPMQSAASIGNRLLGNMSLMGGRNPNGSVVAWGSRPQPTSCTNVQDPTKIYELRNAYTIFGPGTIRNNLMQDNLAYGSANVGLAFAAFGTTCYDGQRCVSGNILRRFTAFGNGVDNPDGANEGGRWGGKNVDVVQEDLNDFSVVEDSKIDRVFVRWPSYPTGTRVFTSLTGGGARLRHRYIDGVLMDGTNGQPVQPLWPWPMESRIWNELGFSVTNLLASIIPDQVPPAGTLPPQAPTGVRVVR